MEKTSWSWAQKGIIALFAAMVACCCVFLAGCAENSEEAVRNVVTTELDAVKNSDTETIEAIAGDSSEFQALSTYGISATDAYEAVFNGFDYKIESVKVDGDKAVVGVKLTAKDLTKFQSALVEAAQNLAKDSSFTSMTTQEMNQAIGKLVLDTIKDLPTTETDTVELDVVKKDGKPVATIQDGDSVIFFNFRPDRAREISRAFCCDEFDGFPREKRLDLTYVCFTEYDATIPNKLVAFHKVELHNTFGEYLAAHDMTQVRIAETEKYAHVTFFFNGGVEEPNKGEDRILVKSPKVATYDLQPEMSAPAVCDKLVEAIKADKYDVIIINFANPDMVGHTGVIPAAVQAIETVDGCVGRAVEAVKEVGGQMFICADHGNAEMMIDYKTGEPWTAHTTNPVPFILVNADPAYGLRENGCLADIIPTLIELMGMEQPKEMTGKSLLVKEV